MAAILLGTAENLENYFALHNTYENFPETFFQTREVYYKNHYHLEKKLTNTGYTLEAIPINRQAQDTECGILTIDENGNKNASGSKEKSRCWM